MTTRHILSSASVRIARGGGKGNYPQIHFTCIQPEIATSFIFFYRYIQIYIEGNIYLRIYNPKRKYHNTEEKKRKKPPEFSTGKYEELEIQEKEKEISG